MSTEITNADLIVVGAGPGGYEIAAAQAGAGQRVVLVEKDLPGGTCLNRGCIPTKCLCASADAIRTVGGAAAFGVDVAGFTADFGRAAARMQEVVASLRDDVSRAVAGCECVTGTASFNAAGNVVVTAPDGTVQEFSAPRIIIATGSKPAVLPVPGAELAETSDEFLQRTSLPASCVVIGGGVIGLEFASVMAAFGTQVTVVEFCKEVLPPFDADIAKRLRSLMSRQGVSFVMGAAVTAISRDGDSLTVTYKGKKGPATVTAEAVLMAVGRRPVLPDGLDLAGIEVTPKGFIVTDDNMATTRPGVFAVGDCNGRMMLAHAASAQARAAVGMDVDLSVIPSAVFTHPEAAMAGLTAEAAEAAAPEGVEIGTAKALFAGNGKARAMGATDGLVKVVYQKPSGRIVGIHIVGPEAANLIAEAVPVIAAGMTLSDVAHRLVHAHPTLSEVLVAACAAAR